MRSSTIKPMKKSFDPSKRLPKEWRIKDADCHLYRIGLSLFKPRSQYRRSIIYNPLLVFSVLLHIHIRCSYLLYRRNVIEPDEYYLYWGAFYNYVGVGPHMNLISILDGLLGMASQVVNYYNYKRDIKPTDIKVFEMMAGFVSPKSIGLTDVNQIKKLLSVCSLTFKMSKRSANFLTMTAFSLVLGTFALKIRSYKLLVFGVPHALFWCFWIRNAMSLMIWQTIYFFIITFYLNIKIKAINEQILAQIDNWTTDDNQFCLKTIRRLYAIYAEVKDYNDRYWSKFLGCFWVIFSTIIAGKIYVGFLSDIHILLKIALNFYLLTYISIVMFIIQVSSEVYSQTERTYLLFHSYCSGIPSLNGQVAIKLNDFLGRIAQKKIGFYCGDLFIINKLSGYEILAMILMLLLKVYDFSLSDK